VWRLHPVLEVVQCLDVCISRVADASVLWAMCGPCDAMPETGACVGATPDAMAEIGACFAQCDSAERRSDAKFHMARSQLLVGATGKGAKLMQ
jgi:hypothetical protein